MELENTFLLTIGISIFNVLISKRYLLLIKSCSSVNADSPSLQAREPLSQKFGGTRFLASPSDFGIQILQGFLCSSL
ncbi:hypothetical protein VNO77_24896 [Canavalia gladiata]|uniref:Uncharacterized protein n=1 Tax=Canavalia gladiata TaxID=3824 RepID=A0AAN9LCD4_CANGL